MHARFILAGNIKTYRATQKLTQDELGRISGVSTREIGKLERSEAAATIDTLDKLADAFGIAVSNLLQEMPS